MSLHFSIFIIIMLFKKTSYGHRKPYLNFVLNKRVNHIRRKKRDWDICYEQ